MRRILSRLVVSAGALLVMIGLVAVPAHAAYSDLYSIRFKAWIPQAQAIGSAVGMKLDSFCSPWPTSTVRFNGNNHVNFVNGSNGDFKTMVQYDFRWDGSRMSDVAAQASYGTTHMTMTNSITGSQCSMSRKASGKSRVEAPSASTAKLVLGSADPFYPAALIPDLDGSITVSFSGRDHMIVQSATDAFPSYAYQVYRNGKLVATVQDLDVSCVSLTGPKGIIATAGLLSTRWQSPTARQDIDTRATGLDFFRPCSSAAAMVPLKYPSVSPPVAKPGNVAPVARFAYKRAVGARDTVTLDGSASSDADGRITSWAWYNGATKIASGPSATVALGAGTSKTVRLVVTDNAGAQASRSAVVSLANRSPRIAAASPATGAQAGTNTPTLSAVAADDDGDALQYRYTVTGPSVSLDSGWTGAAWKVPAHRLDPGTRYEWTVTVRDPSGATARRTSVFTVAPLPTAGDVVSTASGDGYWQVASDGGVFSYGDARFYGSLPGIGVRVTNVIGMARTPSGAGYWLVGRDGGVFAFGDAGFHGSLPSINVPVNNIVGMAPTKSGRGYWLVGADGGVFAFGDAAFYGSMGGKPLNKPMVAIVPTASGAGYWTAAADGGVFAFGDAAFYGSMGGKPLNAPVTDISRTLDGNGYWMTAEDGGVFAFGSAGFYGSMAGKPLNGHITGMSATVSGKGYWLNGCDGGVFAFGDARFFGSNATYQCRGVNQP
ncbi:PKD domain-containing protein [Actinoplanes sp. OR16]|uniref:PKD domain-containing protein n=1 Tax=Actinoplanes sp. OR16 TaxID=946334 RepID=UPI000FDBA013|nr:PKD domain-containing protein [Actinoplanes sp. OR16]